jgi:uncharacterized protein involved in exopolysaccharide biosynthesis
MEQPEKTDPHQGRPSAADGYLDFRESVLFAWKARAYVLGAVLACGLAGFGLGSLQPRLYESSVLLREEQVAGAELAPSKATAALLRSRALAEAAARGSGLTAEAVAAATTIEETVPPSTSVRMRVRLPNPERAVLLANTLGEEASKAARRVVDEREATARDFNDRRLALARERVAETRARVVAFARANPARGRETPDVGAPPGVVRRRGSYSERDAELDRLAIEASMAELLYRDAAVRWQATAEQLTLGRVDLRIVERAVPATPLSRGRLRKAVLGAAAGAVLALVGLFALLIARPPVEPAGPPA